MSLNEKIAFVGGGTGALGSAVAVRLSAEGAEVYASSLSAAGAAEAHRDPTSGITAVRADLTREGDVTQVFETIVRRSGRIDIVVNTVGGFVPRKPLTEVSLEEWDRMMNINLKSTYLTTREALRRMQGSGYGRVINISAMVGLSPAPQRIPYALSKASVSLLTDLVAQEVKGSGITVNAIAPSIIDTKANRASMPDADPSQWITTGQIADLIVYLCSAEAGGVTGTTLKAYGGI